MQIKFRQSGGYAGLIRGCDINSDSLSVGEAAELQSLVEQSGILNLKSKQTAKAADLIGYEITLETRDGIHQVSVDDLSLPERAIPLLDYLQKRARPIPLR